MRVEIRVHDGEVSSALGDQIERRLGFAFGRFGSRVRRVVVHLRDVNGPRGGEDQHCRIEVSLLPSGTIMAEATDTEVALAVGRAAERGARRVRDALERERTMRTRKRTTPREKEHPDEGCSL